MINDLPSVFEIVTGSVKKQAMEKSAVSNNSIHKPKSSSRGVKKIVLDLSLID